MSIKRRSAKNKGRQGQAEIAKKLQDYFGMEESDFMSTPSSVTGMDIMLSSKAKKVFPFAVEVKRTEKINIHEAWRQAKANATEELNPLLVFRKNRDEWKAVLDFDEFLRMNSILVNQGNVIQLLSDKISYMKKKELDEKG